MMHPLDEEPMDQEDWEFYAEAISAWRAWRVINFDGVLILESITYRKRWIPKQEFIAECIQRDSSPVVHVHAAPDLEHGCGIYSLKNVEDAMLWSRQPTNTSRTVYGRVSIWGTCFKFTKGYLSEFAYPAQLYVSEPSPEHEIKTSADDLARELSETYRIEAVIVKDEPGVKKNH